MIALILRPFRERRADRALIQYGEASKALRQAKERGDTRLQHEAQAKVSAAMNNLLRAELALGL